MSGFELVNFSSRKQQEQDANDAYFRSFPSGYRFKPSDEELIHCYLKPKLLNLRLPPNKIIDVDLYKSNPDRLVELHKSYGEGEWYYFTPRDKKYPKGSRPRRSAGDGYWKATGADKIIISEDIEIGYRKALVFYAGKAPKGVKTDWMMHEYRLKDPPVRTQSSEDMRLDDCVLCKIYKKLDKAKKSGELEPSGPDPSGPDPPGPDPLDSFHNDMMLVNNSSPFLDADLAYFSDQFLSSMPEDDPSPMNPTPMNPSGQN